ncbi:MULTISPECIES: YqgE/AlgH family protein [unclassified Nocardiopsis]|jgi:putative transcriptional regulator|uniref:YqgE/AlgH family protein n=1 Tax=unclassified Nocardiopsis TaxID=2649073 RepID=UPI00066BF164|nr:MULTISPECIES: YqgE/AlgH family protein [unclassified Nocardiopsis]MBQ1084537.1 YqgE/AlgH family protein [Nocardiopsis sp. B62]
MDQSTLTGRLLVAAPLLQEDSFRRSVVFVVDDADDGTLGVILNRPLELPVDEVVTDWGAHASAPPVMFSGGPVGTDSGIALGVAPPDEAPPGWAPLEGAAPGPELAGVGLVDLEAPAEVLGAALVSLRVFAGYAGWSAGQLAGEIEDGAWYVVDALSDDLFGGSPETLWPRVLRRQGGEMALLSTYPDDPTMN